MYGIRIITWVFLKLKYFYVRIKNCRIFFHRCVSNETNFNNQKKKFYLSFIFIELLNFWVRVYGISIEYGIVPDYLYVKE